MDFRGDVLPSVIRFQILLETIILNFSPVFSFPGARIPRRDEVLLPGKEKSRMII